MLKSLCRVGSVALGRNKNIVTKRPLFKSAPATKTRTSTRPSIISPIFIQKKSLFNSSSKPDIKLEGKKLFDEVQVAILAQDWVTAVDRWKKILALDISPQVKEGLYQAQMLAVGTLLQKDCTFTDKLHAASIIKLILDEVKDDDGVWQMYFAAKVTGLYDGYEKDPTIREKRVDDYIELINMADEGLRHIKDPNLRDNLNNLLADPEMRSMIDRMDVMLFQAGWNAFQAQNWKLAIEKWDQLLTVPHSRNFAEQMLDNLHHLLAQAMVHTEDDPARVAAMMKRYLDAGKNDNQAWAIYLKHKLDSLDWYEGRVDVNMEDCIELKTMAQKALDWIQTVELRRVAQEALNRSKQYEQTKKN